jgi:hypothetical protein
MAIHITRGNAIFFQSAARPTYPNANSTKAPYNQPLTLPDEFIQQTPNNSNSAHQYEWSPQRQHPTLLINPPPAKASTDNPKKELNQTNNDSKTETRHFCESERVKVVKVVVCGGFIFPVRTVLLRHVTLMRQIGVDGIYQGRMSQIYTTTENKFDDANLVFKMSF